MSAPASTHRGVTGRRSRPPGDRHAALHPSGEEDNHPVIFQKYADSDPWIVVHFLQFAGVLIALAGLVVLYRTLAFARPFRF